MPRASKLTPEQWIEVERRHLVDGESVNSLAKEYKVDESAIRRKINPNKSESKKGKNPLRLLAEQKVIADAKVKDISERISELPIAKQQIVTDLARQLSNVSSHLASAAELSSATAHRLSLFANQELDKVDDVDPMSCIGTLQSVSVLQKMANSSSEIGLNLIKANKETIDSLNKAGNTRAPSGLTHFYGESETTDA